ncbi:MAG: lipoyl(octanoyl) transferase LipB [Deltaproteobacteria bacterium]|nr:lipoyl(octanoyl) transferase LipB [Deltaproteobacteria bacterium]
MSARAVERIRVERLGTISYAEGLARQQALAEAHFEGGAPDTLLVLEHAPVITLGRSGKPANVLLSPEALAERGVELVECDRGGDVTYHGPGQVVCYPIFDLKPDRQDVRRFVADLEEVMIRTAATLGVHARRKEGMIGCWLGDGEAEPWRKIGAIGVHLSRWISTHGLAFNVRTRMDHFQLIVPCGISEYAVTTLEQELPPEALPSNEEIAERLITAFGEVFDAQLV